MPRDVCLLLLLVVVEELTAYSSRTVPPLPKITLYNTNRKSHLVRQKEPSAYFCDDRKCPRSPLTPAYTSALDMAIRLTLPAST